MFSRVLRRESSFLHGLPIRESKNRLSFSRAISNFARIFLSYRQMKSEKMKGFKGIPKSAFTDHQ